MQILQRVSLISHRFVVSRDLIFSGFIEAKRCFLQNHVFGTKREKSFKKTSEILPKPPQIRSETMKRCLKTSFKRNSQQSCERSVKKIRKTAFRSYGTHCTLAGVIRARTSKTVSLGFQRIRSALSVSLSLCWSAPRRPNPWACFSEVNAKT